MTAFDRIERRLPELMDELASAGLPDYFDDMLGATTQVRQRPAWSSFERWLPMGVIARPLPLRPVPWRLIATVALIALVAAATLIYVGSRSRIPPPFGPARNGALVIGTAEGDIVSVDPATGTARALISGPTLDSGPYFSSDGQSLIFDRRLKATDPNASIFIADADGSNPRQLFSPDPSTNLIGLTPGGDRALAIVQVGGHGRLATVRIADGKRTEFDLGLDVTSAAWRPNHDQLVVTAKAGDKVTFWVVNADGTHLRPIAVSDYAINDPTLSPDGHSMAYSTWEPREPVGRIRVVDIDSGKDHAITASVPDGYLWQSPSFMPDGKHLVLYRFVSGSDPVVAQVAIMDIADGSAIVMGPKSENPQPDLTISPDGTKILLNYDPSRTSWMFDADGSNGHPVSFTNVGGVSWQRLAP